MFIQRDLMGLYNVNLLQLTKLLMIQKYAQKMQLQTGNFVEKIIENWCPSNF